MRAAAAVCLSWELLIIEALLVLTALGAAGLAWGLAHARRWRE